MRRAAWLLAACLAVPATAEETGHAAAYAAVGRKDYAAAREIWTKLGDAGDAEARYNLGVMYANGDGVKPNAEEAAKWFQRAALQDNIKAQYNLGVMYANGEGVPQDGKQAVKWLQASAKRGLAKAQYALGLLYEEGQGVAADRAAAEKWYREAAKHGDADAKRAIKQLLAAGNGPTAQPQAFADPAAASPSALDAGAEPKMESTPRGRPENASANGTAANKAKRTRTRKKRATHRAAPQG